jgi:hypothetical protein
MNFCSAQYSRVLAIAVLPSSTSKADPSLSPTSACLESELQIESNDEPIG